jgi:DNA invertase Pin-like site-specific DNA recombinase
MKRVFDMLTEHAPALRPAIAYLRPDGADIQAHQRSTINAFAAHAGYEIVAEFEDGQEGGPDGVYARPGFAKLLKQIELDGAHTIIVEKATDFAQDPISQEVGYAKLRERGIELIAVDSPTSFLKDSPTTPIILQVLDVSSRLEKVIAESLQRGTAKRRRAKTGENWRRTYAEMVPEATLMAKRLNQASRKNGARISLRDISAKLAAAGFVTRDSKPYHPEAIRRMLKGSWPKQSDA